MFGLELKDLLGLAVLAALVTTAGNLLATVLKDFFLSRSFERWKERLTRNAVYRKYRDPIVLAAQELESRLSHICESYPPDYLRAEVLDAAVPEVGINSSDDPYYKRYRLLSTVYRLCAFLGWLELYRQEPAFRECARSTQESPGGRSIA
jgi:hypothetical protein